MVDLYLDDDSLYVAEESKKQQSPTHGRWLNADEFDLLLRREIGGTSPKTTWLPHSEPQVQLLVHIMKERDRLQFDTFCIQNAHFQNPLWAKYRRKGQPESAIRLLRLRCSIPENITRHFFCRDGMPAGIDHVVFDVSMVRLFQYHVLESMPKCLLFEPLNKLIRPRTTEAAYVIVHPKQMPPKEPKMVAQLILDYADPCEIDYVAMEITSDGPRVLPRLNPDLIEQVNEWPTRTLANIATSLPTMQIHFFRDPLGYAQLAQIFAKFSDPAN